MGARIAAVAWRWQMMRVASRMAVRRRLPARKAGGSGSQRVTHNGTLLPAIARALQAASMPHACTASGAADKRERPRPASHEMPARTTTVGLLNRSWTSAAACADSAAGRTARPWRWSWLARTSASSMAVSWGWAPNRNRINHISGIQPS